MINNFFQLLHTPAAKHVFNPWVNVDKENDVDKTAPEKRLLNLKSYLQERTHAKYLLLAEALGYQGGHFTGIPMTSERIILGHKRDQGIDPDHVCRSPLYRTSNTKKHEDGFNEPTATIVWGKLISEGLDTRNFVLWNAFPWHPYKSSKGLLSNRTPTNQEMTAGAQVLDALLKAFDFKKIIALGNKADGSLRAMGIETQKVRHPAMGGAERFREQFFNIVSG